MKRSLGGWIALCCLLLMAQAAQAGNGLTRITDHVYAYIDVLVSIFTTEHTEVTEKVFY